MKVLLYRIYIMIFQNIVLALKKLNFLNKMILFLVV
jgi:hypothetical protein